jgi:hypothetical protein
MVQGGMHVLEQELQTVATEVLRMLSLVREGLERARAALIDGDLEAAERAIDGDAEVDALQNQLEQRILTIIARASRRQGPPLPRQPPSRRSPMSSVPATTPSTSRAPEPSSRPARR